ncbi:MAG: hypothetical protein D6689_15985 [Deltaproteobacteria bacterium]|nr:MAG: hypothetical protein D6689_15985 [Deltaproteobacteria bacterium]
MNRSRWIRPSAIALFSWLLSWSVAGVAEAHIALVSPPHRYAENEQKAEPCGRPGGTRGTNVTVFEPGATITVKWRETINHPSHYRISFDDDGDDDFCYPASKDDLYSCPSVLLDNIPDEPPPSGIFEAQVTLPNIECENCTLQLVQVMYDKVASGWGDNDLYFNCADIALRAGGGGGPDAGAGGGPDAGAGAGPDAGSGGTPADVDGGGCAIGGGRAPAGAPLGLALVAAWALRRRRRR